MKVWLVDDDVDMLKDIESAVVDDPSIEGIGNVDITKLQNISAFEKKMAELESKKSDRPDIIFLDLRFRTTREGYIALDMIKNNEKGFVRSIPTIMFSSGKKEDEVLKSYKKSANAYVEKGANHYKKFKKTLMHWSTETSLP